MGWSRFLRRSRWDDERRKELQDYLLHELDDNIARGMSRDAALHAAHRKLGNTLRIRERIYEMNTVPMLDAAWQDLRYGMRLLVKNPTFAIVAVVTLALGTGANAAIFQLVNALRLRTLPVESAHELVSVGIDPKGNGRTGRGYGGRSIHTEPLWQALRSQQQAFSSLVAWGSDTWDLAAEGQFSPVRGVYVSGNFFETLGVGAHVGRVFTSLDDQKSCEAPGVVLSHDFWRARYGGHSSVVGQSILLDRRRFQIVGVTPPPFFGLEVGRTFDVAVPLCAEPLFRGADSGTGQPHAWWLDIMARLKPGWTAQRAAAHLATISPEIFRTTVSPRFTAETAKIYGAFTFTVQPAPTGVSRLRTQYATPIWILLGATGLVLLVTCANLANLMLARATARDREIAVRLAIGASRARVVRQLLVESLLIAALGALAGLLLAGWLSRALVAFITTESNRLFVNLAPDWRVFGFVTAVAGLSCLLFGLSPALKATRTTPGKAMQSGGRSATEGKEAFALQRGLVVVQVALSLVLIVGALLFTRSFQNLARLDVGFEPNGLVNATIDLRRTAVNADARLQTFDEILARVRALPGVRAAADALIVPLTSAGWNEQILLAGVRQDGIVNFNQVGGEYFETLQTPLVAGRTFDARDRLDAPRTAIVNESFARRYLPNRSPLGEAFQIEPSPGRIAPTYQIVGVVKDTKYLNLREAFMPIAYLPLSQEPEPTPFVEIIVRAETSLSVISPALTRAIVETAPGAAVWYQTVTTNMRNLLVTERLMASLSGFFGLLAMLIATIGLYGAVSYMAMRRKAEIGIRMALGANPHTVVRMVLGESLVLLGAGIVVGVALATLSSRPAASLLFGLEPWDPLSFALAIAALTLVTVLAAWIPARRTSRVSPTIALRE